MDINEIRNLSNEDLEKIIREDKTGDAGLPEYVVSNEELAKAIRETEIWDEKMPILVEELCSRAGINAESETEVNDPENILDLMDKAAQELNVSLGTPWTEPVKDDTRLDAYKYNGEKDYKVYEKFDKQAFSQKRNEVRSANGHTLFPLAYVAANYASRIDDLRAKQNRIDNKIDRRTHKAVSLESKALRRENTNKMFDELFAEKPAIIKAICERNEKKIAKIRDVKIPKNELKLNKQKNKSVVNQRKIRASFAKIDKMQSLSDVIKSFVIINPEKRREAFAQSLDKLHDASKRAIQCKLEKTEVKLEKLTEKVFDNNNKSRDTYSLEEKISKFSEKKNTLTEKMDKLKSLDKPFIKQDNKVIEGISNDVKAQIDEFKQDSRTTEINFSEFAEDLAVSCVEMANEKALEKEPKSKENNEITMDKPSVFKQLESIKSEQKATRTEKSAPAQEKNAAQEEL